MKKIEAIIRPEKLDEAKHALSEKRYIGLHIVGVTGRGVQKGIVHAGRSGQAYSVDMLSKAKLEIVVGDRDAEEVVATIQKSAWTGNIGDGKILHPARRRRHPRTHERARRRRGITDNGAGARRKQGHPLVHTVVAAGQEG